MYAKTFYLIDTKRLSLESFDDFKCNLRHYLKNPHRHRSPIPPQLPSRALPQLAEIKHGSRKDQSIKTTTLIASVSVGSPVTAQAEKLVKSTA